MSSVLVILAVIISCLLLFVSLYMLKTKIIVNNKVYDGLCWAVDKMIMILPIIIGTCESLKMKYCSIIVIVLSGAIALCKVIINKSHKNYKEEKKNVKNKD